MSNPIQVTVSDPLQAIAYLRSTQTIREHCGQIARRLAEKKSDYFLYHPDKWPAICDAVLAITRVNYPDLKVPLHSRWRHFNAGGIDRLKVFTEDLRNLSILEKARIQCEMVILSVLLDAGAGDQWRYRETGTEAFYQRSEGLALASFNLYKNGLFSLDPGRKFFADGERLQQLSVEDLGQALQVSDTNPLAGLAGRCALVNRLGSVIANAPQFFHEKRLGNFFNYLYKKASEKKFVLAGEEILSAVLLAFSEIWPAGLYIDSTNLGDVGRHQHVRGKFGTDGLVPFHKLSQWLSYSLVEPLQEAGVTVSKLDSLTGLAEYRNGGLFLDGGLISLKEPSLAKVAHAPQSELITEWRALTLHFLDQVAEKIRVMLQQAELPLGNILQGGTWAAGRKLAFEMRKDGAPPLQILSDGTVF